MKKHTQKLLRNTQVFLPIAAKMAKTEEIMFQNVAYRPTVYTTVASGDANKYFSSTMHNS